jgi:hypothetical protein
MKTMLFQSPGHKVRPDGTFRSQIFDDCDIEAAMKVGWHRSARDAIAALAEPVVEKPKRGRKRVQPVEE